MIQVFKEGKISNPYKRKEITKLECEGHIQKRVGTRLTKWNWMANLSLIKSRLADWPFEGTGWLTDKMIHKISKLL